MRLFWFLAPARGQFDAPLNEELRAPRLVLWGTAAVLVTFVVWARWAEIDEVTRAPGEVIASSRTQLIQSLDGGVLEELLVREGEIVEPGQLLVRIDSRRAMANYLESRAQVAALSAQVSRLTAEALGTVPDFPPIVAEYPRLRDNEVALMGKREEALQEQIASIEELRSLLEQELDMNRPLVRSGDVSQTELLRLERQIAEQTAKITNTRNEFFQKVQDELSDASAQLQSMEQQMAQRKALLDATELRSRVHGVVKNVRITTIGGVIRPGEEVMQIVPLEDDLLIEAKIAPRDIAFLEPGLHATVKIDAYDYTIYGDLQGELIFISADTLEEGIERNEEPYYRIRVRTEGRRFSNAPDRELNIQPGMTAMVEIQTGRRTVWQYLTKPIVKTLAESLGER